MIYTKDKIFKLIQDEVVRYLNANNDYLISKCSHSNSYITLQKLKAFMNGNTFDKDNVYFAFEDNWKEHKYYIVIYKSVYDKEKRKDVYEYLYKSIPFYSVDCGDKVFTDDIEYSNIAKEKRNKRYEKYFNNGARKRHVINSRVLNAKLLEKIEKLTNKSIKDQKLMFYKNTDSSEPKLTTYYVEYEYRNNTRYICSKHMVYPSSNVCDWKLASVKLGV